MPPVRPFYRRRDRVTSHPGFISAEERAAQSEVRVEKRKQPRYLLTRPIFVVPVLGGGAPHLEGILEGVSIDICRTGISVLAAGPQIDSHDLVIGLETDDGAMRFASARIRHWRMTESGLVFGAQFVEAHLDWLRPSNLALRLDPTTYQFKAALRSEHLHLWAMAGVLRPRLVDWVQLCPKCEGLPTFRYGCPGCGSSHIATSQLMHHFACACGTGCRIRAGRFDRLPEMPREKPGRGGRFRVPDGRVPLPGLRLVGQRPDADRPMSALPIPVSSRRGNRTRADRVLC